MSIAHAFYLVFSLYHFRLTVCWNMQNILNENENSYLKIAGSECTQHIWKFLFFQYSYHISSVFIHTKSVDWGTGEGERKKKNTQQLEKSLKMWENFAMLSKHYVDKNVRFTYEYEWEILIQSAQDAK